MWWEAMALGGEVNVPALPARIHPNLVLNAVGEPGVRQHRYLSQGGDQSFRDVQSQDLQGANQRDECVHFESW